MAIFSPFYRLATGYAQDISIANFKLRKVRKDVKLVANKQTNKERKKERNQNSNFNIDNKLKKSSD